MRILIVEDDADIAANLYDYLESRGHAVDAAADGLSGLRLAEAGGFDAVVLDLRLPRLDGLNLCRWLREGSGADTAVLMLTARDTLDDKLAGFDAGADDYLVKPFALAEIEARLLALTRRARGPTGPRRLCCGDLELDPQTLAVSRAGVAVKLPRKALQLLELFMRAPGRVLRREELERALWGEARETGEALRAQMHLLRRALAATPGGDPFENVHGIGYRLRDGGAR